MTSSRCDGLLATVALSLALSVSSNPVLASASPQETTARHYDLRPLLSQGAPPLPGVTMATHVSASAIDALEPSSYGVWLGDEPVWSAANLAGAVQRYVLCAEPNSRAEVTFEGHWLRIVGGKAAQEEAERALAQLERLILDVAEVELLEIPRGIAIPESGAIKVGPNGSPIQVLAGLSTVIGRTKTLHQTTIRSFLFDYDVEVAQGSVIGDPVVSILRTGTELGVRLDRAADGESFILRTWGRRGSEQSPCRSVPIPVFGGAEIELPAVDSSIWAASARLLPGDSMVIDLGGPSLLGLRLSPGLSNQPNAPMSLGAHALVSMRPRPVPVRWNEPSQGWLDNRENFEQFDRGASGDPLGAAELLEAEGLVQVPVLGSIVLCPADSAVSSEVAQFIESLNQTRSLKEFAIDVCYRILDGETALEFQGPSDQRDLDFEQFAGATDATSLSSSTVGGDATVLVHGVDASHLQDFDTLVAAGSAGPDPIVKSRFVGTSIWCSPMLTPTGKLRAWFDIRVHQDDGSMRTSHAASYHPQHGAGHADNPRFIGEMKLDLPIELPTTVTAGGTTLASLESGKWGHVLTQEFGDTGKTLVVIARIRVE